MIKIITIGKIKRMELKKLIQNYVKMIPRKVNLIEVKDEPKIEGRSIEGSKILKHIKDDEYVITLEILGNMHSSESFSELIEKIESNNTNKITYVIGGSYGLDESVSQRSNYKLSFSKMTFPHQLMKLILVEQIYRAYSIINNHPYHK